MIRKSPAHNYILYLVSLPQGLTNVQIFERLMREQLDGLGDWYINGLRDTARPPRIFKPYDKRHAPSQKWLIETGLFELYFPSPALQEAQRILATPRAKEFVESMLTACAPLAAIQDALPKYLKAQCSLAALERYRFFYWNIELLTSTELRALLIFRTEQVAANRDPLIAAQASAYKRASYSDPIRHAANLPFSSLSALAAQMRLGVTPRNINLASILDMIQQTAAIKSFETLHYGSGPTAPLDAKTYLDIARIALETKDLLNDPDQRMYERLSAVALRTEDKPSITLRELTGGQHTVDLGPRSDPTVGGETDDASSSE